MNPAHPALDATLDRLLQTLGAFNQLLEDEALALASQDVARLSALLPRRDELHRALAQEWLGLSQLAGLPAPTHLEALSARLFADPPPPRWAALTALVHAAERLNQVNGRLIEEQMRRTQVALQILRNSAASRAIYGADGQLTDLPNLHRRIDSV